MRVHSVVPRVDELIAGESALRMKETLLEKEVEVLKTQNEWLSQELDCKSDKLIQLRNERASVVGELESKVVTQEEKVCVGLCGCAHFHVPFFVAVDCAPVLHSGGTSQNLL